LKFQTSGSQVFIPRPTANIAALSRNWKHPSFGEKRFTKPILYNKGREEGCLKENGMGCAEFDYER
jgi:hypothetical protein